MEEWRYIPAESSKNLCREEFSTVQLSEERKSISYKIIHDIVSTNDGLYNMNIQKFQGCPQCTEFDTYLEKPNVDKLLRTWV